VEGAVFMFVVLKWGERITDFFEFKNQAFLEHHATKIQEKNRLHRNNKAGKKKK